MFDLKILYAEDNEKIRDSYTLVLKRYFKEVIEACDGKEALELYRSHNPDIVLTDINMPELDGLELIRIIRQDDKTTKIIVLSAYSDQEKLMKAIPLGLFAYLVKPIKGDDLKKVLTDVASHTEKSEQLKLSNGYVFDIKGRKIYDGSEEIELTIQEFTILDMLAGNIHNPVSSELISFTLWDEYHDENKHKIQNIIKRLRKKVPDLIDSVYGFGYKIK